ncbi:MAG: helix-turn-helix transcriptional regulator [Betaproteobacteria bacterium]|nr:helix-turn-helix transcriptional regulator [Betaproteobacteria bacterium]MDE2122710.1 helix-turn-helix transcriptional regulator [Betaproteobacteria bacterium]MDE2186739.1 helix-turn-helix transcriptional regulator [Betaproteobacteria bacterium]MDE2323731.1 helix-turn-helix transcriptional regulator [Betaproteobacteria bacterium]
MDMRTAGQVREAAQAVERGEADWNAVLDAWRRAGGAESATFLAWDKTAGALCGHSAVDLQMPQALASYVQHFQSLDPMLPIGLQRLAGDWVDSAADLPKSVWHAGPYYADLMRPLRIEQTVALSLCNDARHIASVSLHFSQEVDGEPLKQQLAPLRHALLHAFRARVRATEVQRCKLDALLSGDAEGWLLLDPTLRVHRACPACMQLLSGDSALRIADGRLHARHAQLAQRLRAAVAGVCADHSPRTLHCAAGWGRVLRLLLAPAPQELQVFHERLILLRLRLLDAARLPDLDALRTVYGLTAAEARLVRELVAGHAMDDCACLFGVSRNTLRNQLANVFRKMSCARQSEVVRLAALLS